MATSPTSHSALERQAVANLLMLYHQGLVQQDIDRIQEVGQPERAHARLLRVAGNNQRGLPGDVLPEPLVVRLEDQFRNPVVGELRTAEMRRGIAIFVQTGTDTAVVAPDAQGQARLHVQVGSDEQELWCV